MKAWQDIESPYTAENYLWYIDRGIVIRYYPTEDRYEVKNTMTQTDHYVDVPDDIYEVFATIGWDAGTYMMNVRVLQSRLDRIDNVLLHPRITEERLEWFTEERKKVINKMVDYEQRLVSLIPKTNLIYGTLEREV